MLNQVRRSFTLGLVALCFVGCRQGDLDAGQSTYSGTCEYWSNGEWSEFECFTTVEVEDGRILWWPQLISYDLSFAFPPSGYDLLNCARTSSHLELDWGKQKFDCAGITAVDENGEIIWQRDDWGKVILSGNKLEGQVRMCYSGDDAPEDIRGRFKLVLEE